MPEENNNLIETLSLSGRVACVVGGASGIGKATVHTLAGLGSHVVVADVNRAGADRVARQISEEGRLAESLALDVTDDASAADGFAAIEKTHGRLDILVASVGTGARIPAEEMPTEIWQKVVDLNLTGCFRTAREAAKLMLPRERGSIVFVASIMGLVGGGLYPNPAYQATKGALVNLTRALALDWAQQGVRVNGVAPCYVDTPLTEQLMSHSALKEAALKNTPLGRFAEPSEVAAAIAFLASDAASMITGITLPVDGGWTAH